MGCEFLKSALARPSETLALAESGGCNCKEYRQGAVRAGGAADHTALPILLAGVGGEAPENAR